MAHILVVDDEPAARNILRRYLEKAGHTVRTAEDGDQALELIYTSAPFDLVLLDLSMPRFDGWDFLRMKRMSRRLEGTAVILITGSLIESSSIAELQGAAMIFEKPIDMDKLMSIIGSLTKQSYPPPPPSPPPGLPPSTK